MAEPMTIDIKALSAFGWSHHFQSQLSIDEFAGSVPVRVVAIHRNGLEVAGPDFAGRVPLLPPHPDDGEAQATVGDWLLLDGGTKQPTRSLERRSVFKRKAAGTDRRVQFIAANVDTLVVVTSCNQDFNIARLERYLALAREADVTPLVALTKADLVEDATPYLAAARRLMPGLLVEPLDARAPEAAAVLKPWCGPGQTLALVGSSGVGKSTLVNALSDGAGQETAAIRADAAKGRHTTTGRSMHRLAAGGWLIDTPGMRELQLADVGTGIEAVFADIVALARRCRFADCAHDNEPGCAVRTAIEAGELEPDRLRRFRKLVAEESRNSQALHERHARERAFGKMVKAIMKVKAARGDP